MALLFDEAFMAIMARYFNYNNIFSIENAIKLLKHTRINDYLIELQGK